MNPSGRTRLLGVIGHPIGHTLSPKMHNAAFAASRLDYVYVPMDVRPEDLPAAVSGLRALGFRGLNVTMPHKEAILPLLDELDEAASVSGAANTVVVEERGLRAVPGGRMLLYQGVQAQRIWTGKEPEVRAMNEALS
jgi:shikimate dehydrogenase